MAETVTCYAKYVAASARKSKMYVAFAHAVLVPLFDLIRSLFSDVDRRGDTKFFVKQ